MFFYLPVCLFVCIFGWMINVTSRMCVCACACIDVLKRAFSSTFFEIMIFCSSELMQILTKITVFPLDIMHHIGRSQVIFLSLFACRFPLSTLPTHKKTITFLFFSVGVWLHFFLRNFLYSFSMKVCHFKFPIWMNASNAIQLKCNRILFMSECSWRHFDRCP